MRSSEATGKLFESENKIYKESNLTKLPISRFKKKKKTANQFSAHAFNINFHHENFSTLPKMMMMMMMMMLMMMMMMMMMRCQANIDTNLAKRILRVGLIFDFVSE